MIKALLSSLVVGLLVIWGWMILNWVWLKPKRLEKWLRKQGFTGNSYRFLSGDMKEYFGMTRQSNAKPMPMSDDIAPYVAPFLDQTVRNYGLSRIIVYISIPVFFFFFLMSVTCLGKCRQEFIYVVWSKTKINNYEP